MKCRLLAQENPRATINGIEMLQRMYDSELTFSVSSDCWDGGFTVKVGAQDPAGTTWAKEESGIDGIELALAELLDMILEYYPDSKFTKEIDGVNIIYKEQVCGVSDMCPGISKSSKRCCFVGCDKAAEFEIYDSNDKRDCNYTHACTDHVGHLLGSVPPTKPDGPWTIVIITN